MATIAAAVAAVLARPEFADVNPAEVMVGDWQLKFGTYGQTGSLEYGKLAFYVPNANGTFTPVITPLRVTDRGLPTEACQCNLATVQTDPERFRALVLAWVAARVAADWFVDVNHWGEECALAWGISEVGVIRTAKLTWNAGKTALAIVLDAPNPGAPTESSCALVALANDTTAIAFADGCQRRLTVTADRTLTTTIPKAGTICSLYVLTSGTTSRTITFGSGFRTTGTLATGTTGARVFAITFRSDGTTLNEIARTAAMVA